jgi:hypothetical protein
MVFRKIPPVPQAIVRRPSEREHVFAASVIDVQNPFIPAEHNAVGDIMFSATGPGSYGTAIATGKVEVVPRSWNTDRLNFAPRFGFAYDIRGRGKNVVRGGYGLSYDRMATVYTAGYRENRPSQPQRHSACCWVPRISPTSSATNRSPTLAFR